MAGTGIGSRPWPAVRVDSRGAAMNERLGLGGSQAFLPGTTALLTQDTWLCEVGHSCVE